MSLLSANDVFLKYKKLLKFLPVVLLPTSNLLQIWELILTIRKQKPFIMKVKSPVTIVAVLTISILFFFTSVSSEINPPAIVHSKMNELYPDAIGVQWEIERGKYEAEFTVNGFDVEITLDEHGNVLEMEEEIPYDLFPEEIKTVFEKERNSYKITKTMKLVENGKIQYSLIALLSGTREHFIYSGTGELLYHKIIARDKIKRKNATTDKDFTHTGSKWELPVILSEISGIALLNPSVMACVQDELGIIFLYDLRKNVILSEIEFAGAGDYEGISIVNDDAYVLRSDGTIFEISDFQSELKKVNEYRLKLPKTVQNFEGLCYDEKSNRLLLAPRTFDSDRKDRKGIYAFNLTDKTFSDGIIFSIDLTNPVFNSVKKSSKYEVFIPSEIAVHPSNGDIYFSDARNKQVLVTNADGSIKKLVPLSRHVFPKTEGIAISGDDHIYLSNEGKKTRPTIIRIQAGNLR